MRFRRHPTSSGLHRHPLQFGSTAMFNTPTTVTFRLRLDSSVKTHGKYEAIIFVFNFHLRLCVLGCPGSRLRQRGLRPLKMAHPLVFYASRSVWYMLLSSVLRAISTVAMLVNILPCKGVSYCTRESAKPASMSPLDTRFERRESVGTWSQYHCIAKRVCMSPGGDAESVPMHVSISVEKVFWGWC